MRTLILLNFFLALISQICQEWQGPKTKECFNIIRNLVAFNFIGPSFNNAVSRARDIINIIAIKSNWHVVRAVHDADDLT